MNYSTAAAKTIQRIIITHQYPLDAPGGGTRSCLQIIRHLEQLGVEVIVVQIADKPIAPFQDHGTTIVTIPFNRIHYLFTGLSVAKFVKKTLGEKHIDAVLGWGYEAAFLPKLLKSHNVTFGMIAAAPSYAEWSNRKTGLRQVKQLTDEWFRWRSFKRADVVFVSSEFTQNELIDLFQIQSDRIVITRRGIDQGFDQVERQPTQAISNLIFYGSLAPIKGVFDAIAALGQVAARGHRNWKLKIAGWGDEEALKRAIYEHGIEDHVLFLGRLDPHELAKELAWAHLAILPSQAESFGRSIAEAQASGLPVISYDTGSIAEIVQPRTTGWLALPKQIDRLADAVIEAMQTPETTFQMGLAGRERVTQLFSWEKTTKSILQGIEDAKRRLT